MAILVLAEHDNKSLKKATLNAVAAAQKIGGDIDVLVAGHQAGEAAKAASGINRLLGRARRERKYILTSKCL